MNYPELELYIDGRWKQAEGQPVLNPADESMIGAVPLATQAELDQALAAAADGAQRSGAGPRRAGGPMMLKAAALMRQRVDDIAFSITWSKASRSPRRGPKSSAAASSSNGTRPKASASMGG